MDACAYLADLDPEVRDDRVTLISAGQPYLRFIAFSRAAPKAPVGASGAAVG